LIFIFTLVKTLKSRLVEELYKGKEDHSLAGNRLTRSARIGIGRCKGGAIEISKIRS
jgi:hypothetical protein